jgi:hypothetical protein
MKTLLLAGAFIFGLATVRPADAQRVSGSIVVASGPVAAHIVVNPQRYDYPPRVIVVHRYDRGRPMKYRHDRGYRRFVAWYDPDGDRYYDRYYAGRGVREVVVWQEGGNFYRDEDNRYDRPSQVDNYRQYRSDRAHDDGGYREKDDERNDRGSNDGRR